MKRRDFLRYSIGGGLVLAQPQLLLAANKEQPLYNPHLYNPTRHLFIADSESSQITIFNVMYDKHIDILNFNVQPETIELARDDSMMLVGNSESTDLILYDLKTSLRRDMELPSPLYRAVYVPQSKLVAIVLRDHVAMLDYQKRQLTTYDEPPAISAQDKDSKQEPKVLFSSYTRTFWVLDENKAQIYRKSAYESDDKPWQTIDLSARASVNLSAGFDGGVITPGDHMMALTTKQGNEGYVYYIDQDKLYSTGPMGTVDSTSGSMVRPYIDSSFKRVLFADSNGNVALFDFDKSEKAEHFKVDFTPREFRTGWLETTLIIGGDRGLQFQSFNDLNDKVFFELPSGVVDMWVTGDSKTLYVTLEEGEPQVLRYDIRRRVELKPLLIHGVIKGAALRMGSTNSICH
ncbi:Uncharacterised protein [Oligella ureolytica]|uniref:Uncharacterized protein n=1 Tax=Oligella ureolytica TaxID=90244 RepID=A0A378XGH7_9BURK|nr:hypothetical protein [Oligella ureolytica]QPT39501.1 hypothetical protein I6G29_10105 [Oligella ureolytica]SUA56445.1 Uncharacterised protein [Oligella ureolytica]